MPRDKTKICKIICFANFSSQSDVFFAAFDRISLHLLTAKVAQNSPDGVMCGSVRLPTGSGRCAGLRAIKPSPSLIGCRRSALFPHIAQSGIKVRLTAWCLLSKTPTYLSVILSGANTNPSMSFWVEWAQANGIEPTSTPLSVILSKAGLIFFLSFWAERTKWVQSKNLIESWNHIPEM